MVHALQETRRRAELASVRQTESEYFVIVDSGEGERFSEGKPNSIPG